MRASGLLAVLCGAVLSAAVPQDPRPSEARFHRVQLKDGSVVDGDLVGETAATVIVRTGQGNVTIERNRIIRVDVLTMDALWKTEPAKAPSPARPANAPAEGEIGAALDRLAKADQEHKYEEVRKLVAMGPAASRELAARLESIDGDTRPFVSGAIAEIKDPETVPLVVPFLRSSDPGVRAEAARILGALGGPEQSEALTALLEDSDPLVRAAAISALGSAGNAGSFNAVARLCGDPGAEIRRHAIEAVFALAERHGRKPDIPEVLTRALDRAPGNARADLISAIGATGEERVWTSVAPYLSDDLPAVRAAAAVAMASLKAGDAGESILGRMGREDDAQVRIQLASVARMLKLQGAIDILIEWLSDADPDVRKAAERNLVPLTGQSFGPEPEPWAAWWNGVRPKER